MNEVADREECKENRRWGVDWQLASQARISVTVSHERRKKKCLLSVTLGPYEIVWLVTGLWSYASPPKLTYHRRYKLSMLCGPTQTADSRKIKYKIIMRKQGVVQCKQVWSKFNNKVGNSSLYHNSTFGNQFLKLLQSTSDIRILNLHVKIHFLCPRSTMIWKLEIFKSINLFCSRKKKHYATFF